MGGKKMVCRGNVPLKSSFNSIATVLAVIAFVVMVYAGTANTDSNIVNTNASSTAPTRYNITVNNFNFLPYQNNISEVLIILPSSFTYITGTNDTNATNRTGYGEVSFSNTTTLANFTGLTVLNWSNATGVLFGNFSNQSFYFNATATIHGSFNITVRVRNGTAFNMTNITIFINDSIVPDTIFYNTSTLTDNANYSQNAIPVNITGTDTANVSSILILLFNASGSANSTSRSTVSPFFINFTGLADGAYWFNATINDSANNKNYTATRKVFIDATFPAANFNDNQTRLQGTNISGNSFFINVTLTEANPLGTLFNITYVIANLTGQFNASNYTSASQLINNTHNFTGLTDTVYTYNVTVQDAVGNRNWTVTRTVTVDTIKPSIVFNDSSSTPADNVNASRTAIFVNVTLVETNAGNISFYLFNNTGLVSMANYTMGHLLSNNSHNFTSLSDGAYWFNTTSTDMAGNTNLTVTRKIFLDATFPAANFNDNQTRLQGTNISGNSFFINVTLTEANPLGTLFNITYVLANLTGQFNASNYTAASQLINNSHNFTGLTDTVYTYNVTVQDAVGNRNWTVTRTFAVDTTRPLIVYNDTNNTLSNLVNVSGTAIFVNVTLVETNVGNISFYLYNDTSLVSMANYTMASLQANNSHNFTSLSDGNYTYNVTVMDMAGNTNSTATRRVKLDNTNPSITHSCNSLTPAADSTMTCSCSATDALDSTPTMSYTTNPSTSQTGSFTTECSATDAAGNVATSTLSYTVSLGSGSSSGSSGGSSGSSTTPNWKRTEQVSTQTLEQGATQSLAVNERAQFTVGSSTHHLGVLEVSATTVKIQVASTPQQSVLSVGDVVKFELTNDTYYDLKVTLHSIISGKANLTMQKIYEAMPAVTQAPGTSAPAGSDNATESKTTSGTEASDLGKAKGMSLMTKIVLPVIIALIVVVALVLVMQKRKQKRGY